MRGRPPQKQIIPVKAKWPVSQVGVSASAGKQMREWRYKKIEEPYYWNNPRVVNWLLYVQCVVQLVLAGYTLWVYYIAHQLGELSWCAIYMRLVALLGKKPFGRKENPWGLGPRWTTYFWARLGCDSCLQIKSLKNVVGYVALDSIGYIGMFTWTIQLKNMVWVRYFRQYRVYWCSDNTESFYQHIVLELRIPLWHW